MLHIMSTSNNLEEKPLLQYITHCFSSWGIPIEQHTLKSAKKNEQKSTDALLQTLASLCLLHMLNYTHSIEELGVEFGGSHREMKELVMAHLMEVGCPMVVRMGSNEEGQEVVGFDFRSSRHMLLTCGWVMAVSNFFSRTTPLFHHKLNHIYQAKGFTLSSLGKKGTSLSRPLNLYQDSPRIERVAYLGRVLQTKRNAIEGLVVQRRRLMLSLQQGLRETGMRLEDCLGADARAIEEGQVRLRGEVKFEKQNMKYRKYWWIWLKQKLIKNQFEDLSLAYQTFQRVEVPVESVRYSVEADLEYLPNYYLTAHNHLSRLQAIASYIQQSVGGGRKQFKQIQAEVAHQMKEIRQRTTMQQTAFPSFIGMQVKKYIGIEDQQKKQQEKKKSKKEGGLSNKLVKDTREFVASLESVMFI